MDASTTAELVEAARDYESLFVPALFEQWTKHVIEAARVKAGMHVLDIACGTGVLARRALSRTGQRGRVVGVDPAPGMLAAATEIEPGVDWIRCSAEALDLDDDSFDCVVSQFGMMFFEDCEQAATEMIRVLKPDGSLAIAVWNSVEHNPAYADLIALLERQVGTAAADALRLPFSLGESGKATAPLNDAGFSGVEVETRVEQSRFPSSRQMVEAELRGWLPLFDIFLEESKIESVLAEADAVLSRYANAAGEAVFPASAHVITAHKDQPGR